MEHEKAEAVIQMEEFKKSLESTRADLVSASSQHKMAKAQIDMLNKEKGVALRDNAASYEQSIQLETQVCHMACSPAHACTCSTSTCMYM